MDSKPIFSEEDLSCPVCCDIYDEPVVLSCSHSLCKNCLVKFWATNEFQECPVCRRKSSKSEPTCNLVLKNLCEVFLKNQSQNASDKSEFCILHHEKLKLFCMDDRQPVCFICQASKKHKNHDLCPVDEVVQDQKTELKTVLKLLQEKLKLFKDVKHTSDRTIEQNEVKAKKIEKQIKEELETLKQFIQDEETARLAAVRKEVEQKSQMLKEKSEEMSREITALSDTIRFITEEMNAGDISFLQNFNKTRERAQSTQKDPEKIPGSLLDVAKHVGNLKFNVWEEMQQITQFTPVILDPNTASKHAILSDDLTSVKCISHAKCAEKEDCECIASVITDYNDNEEVEYGCDDEEEEEDIYGVYEEAEDAASPISDIDDNEELEFVPDEEEEENEEIHGVYEDDEDAVSIISDYNDREELDVVCEEEEENEEIHGVYEDDEDAVSTISDYNDHEELDVVCEEEEENEERYQVYEDDVEDAASAITDYNEVEIGADDEEDEKNKERYGVCVDDNHDEIVEYKQEIENPVMRNEDSSNDDDCKVEESREDTLLAQLPGKERLYDQTMVLGFEGFMSGTHCWDTEVGDSANWMIGVMEESVNGCKEDIWKIVYFYDHYETESPKQSTNLLVRDKLHRIRVELDWDRGRVSFSDALNDTHLHTFKHTFTRRIFPVFANSSEHFSLHVLPMKSSVMLIQPKMGTA